MSNKNDASYKCIFLAYDHIDFYQIRAFFYTSANRIKKSAAFQTADIKIFI